MGLLVSDKKIFKVLPIGVYVKLEMCQYETDASTQGPSSLGNKDFAKNEVEKGPYLP